MHFIKHSIKHGNCCSRLFNLYTKLYPIIGDKNEHDPCRPKQHPSLEGKNLIVNIFINIGHYNWSRATSWWESQDNTIRYRYDQVYILWFLPRSMSSGCNSRGEHYGLPYSNLIDIKIYCSTIIYKTHWDKLFFSLSRAFWVTKLLVYILETGEYRLLEVNVLKLGYWGPILSLFNLLLNLFLGSKLWVFYWDSPGAPLQQRKTSWKWRSVGGWDSGQHPSWLSLSLRARKVWDE